MSLLRSLFHGCSLPSLASSSITSAAPRASASLRVLAGSVGGGLSGAARRGGSAAGGSPLLGRLLPARSVFIAVQTTPNPDSMKFVPEGQVVLPEKMGTGMVRGWGGGGAPTVPLFMQKGGAQ